MCICGCRGLFTAQSGTHMGSHMKRVRLRCLIGGSCSSVWKAASDTLGAGVPEPVHPVQ